MDCTACHRSQGSARLCLGFKGKASIDCHLAGTLAKQSPAPTPQATTAGVFSSLIYMELCLYDQHHSEYAASTEEKWGMFMSEHTGVGQRWRRGGGEGVSFTQSCKRTMRDAEGGGNHQEPQERMPRWCLSQEVLLRERKLGRLAKRWGRPLKLQVCSATLPARILSCSLRWSGGATVDS